MSRIKISALVIGVLAAAGLIAVAVAIAAAVRGGRLLEEAARGGGT